MLALSVCLAFLLDGLGHLIVGLSAFWLEDTSGLYLIYTRLTMILGGMLIPLDLFPGWLKNLVVYLPFPYLVWGPVHLLSTPQTELAASLGASESNVSTLIERMRRDGLLLRMRSRVDRRCSVLLLTELGAERLSTVTEGRDRHLARWIDQLTSDEQTLLCHLLDRLLNVLDTARPQESPTQTQPTEWGQAA